MTPILTAALAAIAWAFPDTDPRERSVLTAPPPPSLSRGTWSSVDGLHLEAPANPTSSTAYWLSADPEHWVEDGLVRALVRRDGPFDGTVIVRASVGADSPESLDALGLSLEGEQLVWHRWVDGVVRATGASTPLEVGRRTEVEVVIGMVGPLLTAFAYDPVTLQQLGAVALREAGVSGGLVGFRVNPRQAGTRLMAMTTLEEDPRRAALADSSTEVAAAREQTPHGDERLLVVGAASEASLPADLKQRVLGAWPLSGRQDEVALLTDPTGVERARRAGVDIREVRGEIPFWAFSPEYRAQRGKPPVPTASGFRLDLGYKDAAMVADLVQAYAARYPALARVVELGASRQERPLLALRISDHPAQDEDEPAVLLMAAHHGSELLATEYALDAMARLLEGYGKDPRITTWVDGLEIWCVPLVNPDGNVIALEQSREVGRKNAHDVDQNGRLDLHEGVDLNRNYPFRWGGLDEEGSRSWPHSSYYRGPSPASEPETRAIMALAGRRHFAGALSFHTNGTVVLSPYTIDGVENPSPDEAWAIAGELARAAGPQPEGRQFRVIRKLYPVDGTDQDWLRHEFGTVAYIVEGSHHNPTSPLVRKGSIAGVRPIVDTFLQRILAGPRVSGHVSAAGGGPLAAEVHLAEVTLGAGERWRAREGDGRFDRLTIGPGRYTVVAEAHGFRTATRVVDVPSGPIVVDLVLEPETAP